MRTRKYNRHHIRTQKKRKRRNKKKRTLQRGGSRRSLQKYSGTGREAELAEQVRSHRVAEAAEKAAIGFVGTIIQMVTTKSRFDNKTRFPEGVIIGNLKNRLPERNKVQAKTDRIKSYGLLPIDEKESERVHFNEIDTDIDAKNPSAGETDVENTVAFVKGIGRERTRSKTEEAKAAEAAAAAKAAEAAQPEVGTTLPKTTSGSSGSSVFTAGTDPYRTNLTQ